MDTDRKLGEVAANLDDISDTLEEIKDAVHEGGTPSEGTLDGLQQDVDDASDARTQMAVASRLIPSPVRWTNAKTAAVIASASLSQTNPEAPEWSYTDASTASESHS